MRQLKIHSPLTPQTLTTELLECAFTTANSMQKKQQCIDIAKICHELALEILNKTYTPNLYTRFAVTDPKLREIYAPAFKDRLAQCWLVKYADPLIERHFIEDTFANRVNKGSLKAIKRVQQFMRQPNHSKFLQLDISAFFNSIHRPTLLKLWLDYLAKFNTGINAELEYISKGILMQNVSDSPHVMSGSRSLLKQIPDHKLLHNAGYNTGIPIGSVSSQLFANFYLSPLDHFIKHTLRVKGYTRYMDDLFLLGDSTAQLNEWKSQIQTFVTEELKLKLHPTKQHLQFCDQGADYLGYRVYPHYIHLKKRNVNKLYRYLEFFNRLIEPLDSKNPEESARKISHIKPPDTMAWREIIADCYSIYTSKNRQSKMLMFFPHLKRMEATINSYYALMQHANHYKLRKTLYHNHFGILKRYFKQANSDYFSIKIKKWVMCSIPIRG
ncbi:RNA-directed DNA polymerase [Orbaceae bacterium ac157xtp]